MRNVNMRYTKLDGSRGMNLRGHDSGNSTGQQAVTTAITTARLAVIAAAGVIAPTGTRFSWNNRNFA